MVHSHKIASFISAAIVLACASAASAQVPPDIWAAAGIAGIVDEADQNIHQFNSTGSVSIKYSVASGTLDIRFPLQTLPSHDAPAGACTEMRAVLRDTMRAVRRLFATTLALAPFLTQHSMPRPEPVEPLAAIAEAFRTHSLVALAEPHGNEQAHAFRVALVRDPRFTATVNDIVVEFGNAKFQDRVDRFVAGGEVSDDELRHVWQDTTQITGVWDRPIYEEFFRAVRAVNQSLPHTRKLRVLLGDPPLDWDRVRWSNEGPASAREGKVRLHGMWVDRAEARALDRDGHAADVVRREVLAKNRRALLIFGDMHLRRAGQSLVSRLESANGPRVFSVTNAVGASSEALLAAVPTVPSWTVPSMLLIPPREALVMGPLGQFDAVLYLGLPAQMTISRLPASLCADATYLKMRQDRMRWNGLSPADAERMLERDCGERR